MKYLNIVFFGVVIVLIMVFLLEFTNIDSPKNSYPLQAFFSNTGGIKKGAPIMMAGLEVGQVEEVSLNQEKRGVNMTLAVFEGKQIPIDSTFKVAEKGMLGEMYLSIQFGESNEYLKANDHVEGNPPVSLTDFMGDAGGAVENVGREVTNLAASLNKILGDAKLQDDVKKSVDNLPEIIETLQQTIVENRKSLRSLLEAFALLGKNSNYLVLDIKEQIQKLEDGKVMDNVAKVSENLVKVSHDIGVVANKIDPLVTSIHKSVDGFEGIGGDVKQAVSKVNKTLEGMEGIGDELNKTVAELHVLLKKLNRPKGTGGKLINDGDLYDNLNALMIKTTSLVALLEDNPSSLIWGKRKKSETEEFKRRYDRLRDGVDGQNPQPVLPEQLKINDL